MLKNKRKRKKAKWSSLWFSKHRKKRKRRKL